MPWERKSADTNKIRLGFVGANVRSVWAAQSHYPALLASPDVEWTAVCTSRPESAEEARRTFGAKLAFHDYREMVASPAIDAVAVVVRVPEHYGPTKAAIEAGKHVYTEWPLGRTTADPSGRWTLTSHRLPNGRYHIFAKGVAAADPKWPLVRVTPKASLGTIAVDA